jgi:hypothetical protein
MQRHSPRIPKANRINPENKAMAAIPQQNSGELSVMFKKPANPAIEKIKPKTIGKKGGN